MRIKVNLEQLQLAIKTLQKDSTQIDLTIDLSDNNKAHLISFDAKGEVRITLWESSLQELPTIRKTERLYDETK